MMEAYMLKYHRRLIFCLCCEKEKSKKFYDWMNHDNNFYRYSFSREIKTGEINGFSYLMTEILDHTIKNRKRIKRQLNKKFDIKLTTEDTCNINKTGEDLKTVFGLSLERIVELHK